MGTSRNHEIIIYAVRIKARNLITEQFISLDKDSTGGAVTKNHRTKPTKHVMVRAF